MINPEHEITKLRWALKTKENIIDRLQEAIRRLADQDATLSIEGGNVTVTMDAGLTDEELKAIAYAELSLRCERHPVCEGHTAVLRNLLERLT